MSAPTKNPEREAVGIFNSSLFAFHLSLIPRSGFLEVNGFKGVLLQEVPTAEAAGTSFYGLPLVYYALGEAGEVADFEPDAVIEDGGAGEEAEHLVLLAL